MVTLPIWLLLALPAVAQAPERPNVVLIISDDQGWRDFGFMGSTEVRTPHLDALAEESLVFPRGYVPTALCRASLATLVTGLYPHQHKITGNDPPSGTDRARMLAHIESVETLPRLLGVAGYRSLQTGKWWEGNCKCGGFSDGMTHGDPNRGGRHGDDGLTIGRETLQPALDFIDACSAKGVPFFLWYAPLLPHRPHDPPARILETYSRPNVPTPIARYRAMCTWFDETCGELLEHLAVREIEEKTLVVFVTDNGWIQRPDAAGYAPRSKRTPYEGGVRTPILVRWLGTIDPARCEVPVSSVDIASTILEACRLEVPAEWPGVDLRSDLRNRGPVFGAAFTHDVVAVDDPERSLLTRWVLRDPLKLLVHSNPPRPTELYDVRADPAEEHPLDNPGAVRALRADLDRWWPSRAGKDQLPDPDGKSADMRKPVQVYILMGQSNMLGFGKIKGDDGSLEHAVKKKGLYPYLVDNDGDWTVRQDVRNVRVMGSGTGGMRQFNNEFMTITSGNIGPEIGIGHHMGHVIKAPVLVLKSCVGNRSLGWDLLPPGSEQYEHEGKIYAGYKESPDSWDKGAEPEPIGWYAGMQYDGDVARAKKVLDELNKYYPDAKHYEVAGFFWWQGDKDRYNAAHASKYEDNLVRLIKQLRREFDAPKAKFVIATLGQTKKGSTGNEGIILDAMLGVDGQSGKYPEFEGNVATVYSHPLSKGGSSNGHYSGNAETYMNIGEAMGKAMAELIEGKGRKSKRRR